jgi:DNA-binding response OmpR family regulator
MNKKIMVVDDDSYILIALRELFENHGFEVYTVPSGKDCIYELKNGFQGVILMDIMMPFMNGWDTIREIIKENLHKDITISILTAKDMPDPDMQDLRAYVKDYITKPFEPQELVSIVRNYFKNN